MKKYIFALISIFVITLASCKQAPDPSTEVNETVVDTTATRIDSTSTAVDTTEVKSDILK
jgi:PBP1b-binding outer membrane lipoprotein LpoB